MRSMKANWSLFLTLWILSTSAWAAPDALIKWPNFDNLAEQATDVTSITLDEQLLKMATRFLSSDDPQDADVQKILQGLRGIYVKSYTFRDAFVYPKGEIDAIRKQLIAPEWSQIVDVRSTKEQANIGIYLSIDGKNSVNGLVIIATEPHEFTIVNIVGAIDLDRLKRIEGKFGIPKLDVDATQSKRK